MTDQASALPILDGRLLIDEPHGGSRNMALDEVLLENAHAGQLTLESLQIVDTQQDRGLLGISAPKAFKLTTVERTKMVSANVQLLFATGLLSQLPLT